MDMQAALSLAVGKLLDSGKIEAAIEKAVEKTVLDVVAEQLRSYSDFGRQIGDAVKEAMTLKNLSLPEYNAILLDAITRHVDATMHKAAADSIKVFATEMLRQPPETIKLSEMVDEYKDYIRDRYLPEDLGDEITVAIKTNSSLIAGTTSSSTWVGLHPKSGKDEYLCDFRFHLYSYEGKTTLASFWILGREAKAQTSNLFLGNGYGFERTLFQMWTAKTPIILDVGSIDRMMPERECECP